MITAIDHVVVAVPDPDAAADRLERDLGLEVAAGGRHEAWGTFNRLAWFGDTYVELIGVFDSTLAERSWIGGPTLRRLEAGGGLVAWALAADAISDDAARLRALGAELAGVVAGERRRPDGRTVRWRLAVPAGLGPTAPFLIEHDTAAAEWTREDRAARAARRHPVGGPIRLEVLELPVADVNQAGQRLLRGAGLRFRPSLAGGGARDANVGAQVLRLRPERPGDRWRVGERGDLVSSEAPGERRTAVLRLAGRGLPSRSLDALACRWVLRPG